MQLVLVCLGAAIAGYGAKLLGIPLPWMIGPMVFTGTIALTGILPTVPKPFRGTGQIIVATAVGLYFTPSALVVLAQQFPYMIGGAFYTIGLGLLIAMGLTRAMGTDPRTALLACIPGGPVEMANMADRVGGDGASVALVQTLRIAFIVIVIPPLLIWVSPGNPIDIAATPVEVNPLGLAALFAITAAVGVLGDRVDLNNALFIGPLGVTAALTALGIHFSDVPGPLLAGGQLLLGVSLGARFDRELLLGSPKFVVSALVTTVFMLAGCALAAWVIAAMTGMPLNVMVLAMAPGSVTEMVLTAKILGQAVPLVAAYHVVRLFVILPLIPVLARRVRLPV